MLTTMTVIAYLTFGDIKQFIVSKYTVLNMNYCKKSTTFLLPLYILDIIRYVVKSK